MWGKFKSVLEIVLFYIRFKHHILLGLWWVEGGNRSALKQDIRTDNITRQGCGYIWAYVETHLGLKPQFCDWLHAAQQVAVCAPHQVVPSLRHCHVPVDRAVPGRHPKLCLQSESVPSLLSGLQHPLCLPLLCFPLWKNVNFQDYSEAQDHPFCNEPGFKSQLGSLLALWFGAWYLIFWASVSSFVKWGSREGLQRVVDKMK